MKIKSKIQNHKAIFDTPFKTIQLFKQNKKRKDKQKEETKKKLIKN